MRIIAGSARGRRLQSLPGQDTRPTTDRLKESMFSILHFHLEGRRVLDLYAGTGQLGLEALSRGAAHCSFVDLSPAAAKVIAANVAHCGFQAASTVHTGDVPRFLAAQTLPYDVILLDPPYAAGLVSRTLALIAQRDLLRPGGFALAEHATGEPIDAPAAPYRLHKSYVYKAKTLTLWERLGEDA